MWLNERARQTGGAGYECAGVTLGGSQVETVASAHLRETPVSGTRRGGAARSRRRGGAPVPGRYGADKRSGHQ